MWLLSVFFSISELILTSYENIENCEIYQSFSPFLNQSLILVLSSGSDLISDQKFFSSMWPLMTLKVLSKGFWKNVFAGRPWLHDDQRDAPKQQKTNPRSTPFHPSLEK